MREMEYPSDFIAEAKEIFPNNEELLTAIRCGEGQKVGDIINRSIGAGYRPNAIRVAQLIRSGDGEIIAKEAELAARMLDLHTRWSQLYRENYAIVYKK